MVARLVVEAEPSREDPQALRVGAIGTGIGPLGEQRADEALGLAVGPWHVGPGANELELEDTAGFGKSLRDVGRSVVARHLMNNQCLVYGQINNFKMRIVKIVHTLE